MEIPIELFITFIGTSIALALFGFMRNPQIPATVVFAGMFILFIAVTTDNIIIDSFASESRAERVIYDVPNTLATADISASGQYIRAEYPSASNSMLINERFDCMEINLRKVNNPPLGTLVQVGVFNDEGDIVREFGNINVTNITTDFFFYTECLPLGEYYEIGSLPNQVERIGIKWNDGDATNRLQTRFDNTDPFDSTITHLASYDGVSWSDSTTNDLTMILTLRGNGNEILDRNFEFTELPKTIFALLGAVFMLSGALMVFKGER